MLEELRAEFNEKLREINNCVETKGKKKKGKEELVAVEKELETLKVTLEEKRELLGQREEVDSKKAGFRRLVFLDTKNIELELLWLRFNKPEEDAVSLFLENINAEEEGTTHRVDLKKDFVDLMKVSEEVSVSVKNFLKEKISSIELPSVIEVNEVKELLLSNNVGAIKGDNNIKRHMVKKFNFSLKQLLCLSIVLYEVFKNYKSFEINDHLIEELKKKGNDECYEANGTDIIFTNYDIKSGSKNELPNENERIEEVDERENKSIKDNSSLSFNKSKSSKSSKNSSISHISNSKKMKDKESNKSSSKKSKTNKEEKEISEKQIEEEEKAALFIQKKYKLKKKEMKEKSDKQKQKEEEEKAALFIQKKYKLKKKEIKEKSDKQKQKEEEEKAALFIQKKYKLKKKEMKEKSEKQKQKEEEEKAALFIQKKYKLKKKEMEKKQKAEEEKAALFIQKKYKQKIKEKEEKKIKEEQEKAAILIQKKYKLKRKEMEKKRKEEEEKAAIKIQSLYKVKMEKRKLDKKMKAIVLIQKMIKAYLQRKNYYKLKAQIEKIETSNNNDNKIFQEEQVEGNDKLPSSNNKQNNTNEHNTSELKEISCDDEALEGSEFDDFLEEETIRDSAFNQFDSRTIDDENIRNSIFSRNSNVYSHLSQFQKQQKRSTISTFKEPKSHQKKKRFSAKNEKAKTVVNPVKNNGDNQHASDMKNSDTNLYDKFPTYKSRSSVANGKNTELNKGVHYSKERSDGRPKNKTGFALTQTVKIEPKENVSQSIQQRKEGSMTSNKEGNKHNQMNKLIQSVNIDKEGSQNQLNTDEDSEKIDTMFSRIYKNDFKESSQDYLKKVYRSAIHKIARKSVGIGRDKIIKEDEKPKIVEKKVKQEVNSEIKENIKEEVVEDVKEVVKEEVKEDEEEVEERIQESEKKHKKKSNRNRSDVSEFDTSSFEEYNC